MMERFACPECGGTEFVLDERGWMRTPMEVRWTDEGFIAEIAGRGEFSDEGERRTACAACDWADVRIAAVKDGGEIVG